MAFKFITAEEAAEFIHHNDNVGFSGFTAAGTPKVVSVALAKKAEAEHAAGRPFQIGVYTGASTSDYIDGALSRGKSNQKPYALSITQGLTRSDQQQRNRLFRFTLVSPCANPSLRISR